MPGLARKLVICAAVDGLILQPHSSKKEQRPSPPFLIRYGDASISSLSRDLGPDISKPNCSFEAFGIVGLITVSKSSYLISITRRQQVATLRGVPIYVVSEVAVTPCSSQPDALAAVGKTLLQLQKRPADKSQDGAEDDTDADDDSLSRISDEVGDASDLESEEARANTWSTAATANTSARSSIAEDVISRRGSYGRFAQRWFSRAGWKMDQKRAMGLTDAPGGAEQNDKPPPAEEGVKKVATNENEPDVSGATRLLPRLLRTAQILFGTSRSFYFAYDCDITRSMANPRVPATSLQPLHNHVEPLFFWNHHVIQPFVDAGADAFALPLMEGFVGQRCFVVDSQPPQTDTDAKNALEMSDFSQTSGADSPGPTADDRAGATDLRPSEKRFDITLISRRSIKRAGLRYLRRGIDDQGYVANSVESEQILAPTTLDPTGKIYSFVQIRGSIPVFFTQSPYSLRPTPVLQHSAEANVSAMKKHFAHIQERYGRLQIVNLVEKHGSEATVGGAYQDNVERLDKESSATSATTTTTTPFEWWDFHAECRGMKFENVSKLVQMLGPELDRQGSTVEAADSGRLSAQQGVFRTNCMDCLDRTNVCQSSFAKYMLEAQLRAEGFDPGVQRDQENGWFNTLWADNGDAISKQYASTAAMKGDYTRTRKRNYRGALTDAGLSLTRFFNGMVNDFFLQATLDFLLGNVTTLVFEEFEADMMTKDPAVSMQRMREQAIETSQKRVVADESEEFVGGWTLLTPRVPDSVRATAPLEEAVLLLTDAALYLCRFDWNLDKVSSFERVELAHVEAIRFGTYITATNTPAQTDENRNVGLVVSYRPGSRDVTRVNTRSLSSATADPASDPLARRRAPAQSGLAYLLARGRSSAQQPADPRLQQQQQQPPRKIALKALPQSSIAVAAGRSRLTEIQQVVSICAEMERLALRAQQSARGPPFRSTELEGAAAEGEGEGAKRTLVEKGDIISLEEARRSTGLLETLGHSIKRMVWA